MHILTLTFLPLFYRVMQMWPVRCPRIGQIYLVVHMGNSCGDMDMSILNFTLVVIYYFQVFTYICAHGRNRVYSADQDPLLITWINSKSAMDAWIIRIIHYKVWDLITYPCTVEACRTVFYFCQVIRQLLNAWNQNNYLIFLPNDCKFIKCFL